MQKKYRGTLKNVMQTAVFKERLEQIKKNKKASEDEKALLEKYKNAEPLTTDEEVLANLVDNIIKSSKKIGEALGLNNSKIDKFSSIFSFAQIQQIAFAERNGNAKTCAVCSADNAHRMQTIPDQSKSDQQSSAKAQRLSAIPTRVIDGAVKKMATILARNIVDDNWHNIKQTLSNKQGLHIPIITESNAFEFEPNLAAIKGKKPKGNELEKINKERKKDKLKEITPNEYVIKNKNDRIKQFAKGISAYSGGELSSGNFNGSKEELDHIIPRTSKYYGTLNDEANLICVTRDDNKDKGNEIYDLSKLANSYKRKQFATTDNSKIKNWIAEKIWDGEKGTFKFGNYRSFINLSVEERVAFRHALFLDDNNPVRKAVINAINNRNRAFVNGTQRYFAEVLANNIYLRAKKENLATEKLSFDYFGVATTNSNGEGIADIRKLYEAVDSDIESYAKGDRPQDSYSHLIDAMLAFCIAADEHKNDGSIGLEVDNTYSLYPLDKDTGEVFTKDIFSQIKVADGEFGEEKLARQKSTETNFTSKVMWDDNPLSLNFLSLIEVCYKGENNKELLIGFLDLKEIKKNICDLGKYKNYAKIIDKDEDKSYYESIFDKFLYRRKIIVKDFAVSNKCVDISIRTINKDEVCNFLVEHFNTKTLPFDWSDENKRVYEILKDISFLTKRKEIKEAKDLEEKKEAKDSEKIKDYKTNGLCHVGLKKQWDNIKKAYKSNKGKSFNSFLEEYFKPTNNIKNHQKARKKFSLPIIQRGQAAFIIKRKSWNGSPIFQIQSTKQDSNANVTFVKMQENGNDFKDVLMPYFRSKNICMFKSMDNIDKELLPYDEKNKIDEDSWYPLNVPEEFKDKIAKIENNFQSKKESNYRVVYKNYPTFNDLVNLMYGIRDKSQDSYFKGANNKWLNKDDTVRKLSDEKEQIPSEQKERSIEQKDRFKYINKLLKILDSNNNESINNNENIEQLVIKNSKKSEHFRIKGMSEFKEIFGNDPWEFLPNLKNNNLAEDMPHLDVSVYEKYYQFKILSQDKESQFNELAKKWVGLIDSIDKKDGKTLSYRRAVGLKNETPNN